MMSTATGGKSARTAENGKKESMLDVYWWSLTYLKPYLGTLVLLVAAMTVVSAAELAVPKIMQVFIDTVIPGKASCSIICSVHTSNAKPR